MNTDLMFRRGKERRDIMIEIDEIISNTEYCADVYERMNKAIHPALQVSDYKRHAEDHKQLAEWLKELKQLREQTRWVPVSERLPEESGRYIVSVLDGIDRRTTVAPYQPRCKAWTMTGRMAYWKVIAWMPLPEPYKAESEG